MTSWIHNTKDKSKFNMKYDGPILHERFQWIYAKLWELSGVGKEQKENEALSP